jgi:glutaconyl-CoA decarboxylase
MTKKYRITVDGSSYEVEVEELGSGAVSTGKAESASAPVAAPKAQQAPAAKAKKEAPAPAAVSEGTETVDAPMPGKILKVAVQPGTEVKEGDLLLILEAMKMENEIFSPAAGKVTEVRAHEGDSVNTGDTLVVLG